MRILGLGLKDGKVDGNFIRKKDVNLIVQKERGG